MWYLETGRFSLKRHCGDGPSLRSYKQQRWGKHQIKWYARTSSLHGHSTQFNLTRSIPNVSAYGKIEVTLTRSLLLLLRVIDGIYDTIKNRDNWWKTVPRMEPVKQPWQKITLLTHRSTNWAILPLHGTVMKIGIEFSVRVIGPRIPGEAG